MNYLRLLFLLFSVGQSVLFAQKDSIKKRFKPYGLIDAAPVAINKDDFKPQIILTIHALDAITNLPVNVKFDYYPYGDSVTSTKSGKIVSLAINGNEKICVVSNAKGYIWQTQIFDTPITDTSYVLKFKKFNKGDIITKQTIYFNSQSTNLDFYLNPDLLGLQEFLNLNQNVKIQVSACPDGKEKVYDYLIKNCDKRRFRLKKCRNKKQTNFETITIKILKF